MSDNNLTPEKEVERFLRDCISTSQLYKPKFVQALRHFESQARRIAELEQKLSDADAVRAVDAQTIEDLLAKQSPPPNATQRAKWWDLPLGTRFRYINGKDVWVKLSHDDSGVVAEWKGVILKYIGQRICSFAESRDEAKTLEVDVCEPSPEPDTTQWRPIDAAPKDGSVFIAYDPTATDPSGELLLCQWWEEENGWLSSAGFMAPDISAWMPKPKTPKLPVETEASKQFDFSVPHYSCSAPNCPRNHQSKWDVCKASETGESQT